MIGFLKKHRGTIVAFTAIFLTYLIFALVGIGCPIKFVTGISCAGCGMTRAVICACTGRFSEAFKYHPLWVLVIPSIVWMLHKPHKYRKIHEMGIALIVGAFLVVYLIRMFDPSDTVVVFEPGQNLLFRLTGLNQVMEETI